MKLTEQAHYLKEIKDKIESSPVLVEEQKSKYIGALDQALGFLYKAEKLDIQRSEFSWCLRLGKNRLQEKRNEIALNRELYDFLFQDKSNNVE